MVTNVIQQSTKWMMAKQIAKAHGYFIVNLGTLSTPKYLLYRERNDYCDNNIFVGKRSSIDGILSLVKKVTGFK